MSKFSKAIKKMNKAEKLLKPTIHLSKDPKEAELEQKLLDISDKVKKEGIDARA